MHELAQLQLPSDHALSRRFELCHNRALMQGLVLPAQPIPLCLMPNDMNFFSWLLEVVPRFHDGLDPRRLWWAPQLFKLCQSGTVCMLSLIMPAQPIPEGLSLRGVLQSGCAAAPAPAQGMLCEL